MLTLSLFFRFFILIHIFLFYDLRDCFKLPLPATATRHIRYFISILWCRSRSLAMVSSRIWRTRSRVSPSWSPYFFQTFLVASYAKALADDGQFGFLGTSDSSNVDSSGFGFPVLLCPARHLDYRYHPAPAMA